ncbi:MAG: DUF87 domain-containing protein [Candidatus Gottesmanbacteria bacterium]
MDRDFVVVEIKNTRDSEETPLAMEQVFAAMGSGKPQGLMSRLLQGKSKESWLSFEIVAVDSAIHFYLVTTKTTRAYIESQLTAQYPKLAITETKDVISRLFETARAVTQLVLASPFYYPLKTYKDVRDIDLLSSVLGCLAKLHKDQSAAIQIRVVPAGASWQRHAASVVSHGIPDPSFPGRTKNHPQARLIEGKTNQVGFQTTIRVVATGASQEAAQSTLQTVAGTFGVFGLGEGNTLVTNKPAFWQRKKLETAMVDRSGAFAPKFHVFGASELASLWHPPGLLLSAIKNISWGATLTGEAPENLPIATDNEEDKKKINFFARTEFKNKPTTFGIKSDDRRKHLYVVGKTGTGKSTMIANMAINDMRNHEGMAVVDPHGDLTDALLDYIPSFRLNDIAYLDPSDVAHPFHLNPLELKNPAHRELVASGIVSIFYKLYHYSWGPRLEYILRNCILTLLYVPNSTLLAIPEILTNDRYREKIVMQLPDQVLKNFWINEYNKLSPQMRSESIMPILNKVGQFLSSQTIRNIVGSPKSTIDLEEMMNKGKIILVNLSQGKLGEDNSALLGAMIITKIQLAAMNRVYEAEHARKDFYLYVDEFQNFATSSFIKILSEARKYRLNLTLANQYIGQIDEDVQNAIFGNAGSIVSFCVGATDARPLAREFGLKYKEEELVQLGNYQIVLKLSIDNHTSSPFSATTLPLPRSHNQSREKVIRASRERYTKTIEK